jgi:hypothetical protein
MPTYRSENRASARSDSRHLSQEELDAEAVVDLPDREAMSTIQGPIGLDNGNVAIPINEATAANVNSDYSVAIADADQFVIVDQADIDSDPDADSDSDSPERHRGGRWR